MAPEALAADVDLTHGWFGGFRDSRVERDFAEWQALREANTRLWVGMMCGCAGFVYELTGTGAAFWEGRFWIGFLPAVAHFVNGVVYLLVFVLKLPWRVHWLASVSTLVVSALVFAPSVRFHTDRLLRENGCEIGSPVCLQGEWVEAPHGSDSDRGMRAMLGSLVADVETTRAALSHATIFAASALFTPPDSRTYTALIAVIVAAVSDAYGTSPISDPYMLVITATEVLLAVGMAWGAGLLRTRTSRELYAARAQLARVMPNDSTGRVTGECDGKDGSAQVGTRCLSASADDDYAAVLAPLLPSRRS